MIRNLMELTCLCCLVLPMANCCVGQTLGSGEISGVFTDDIVTQSAPLSFDADPKDFFNSQNDVVVPVSQGAGSGSYGWGVANYATRYLLDGVEISTQEIFDSLYGDSDPLVGVGTREYGLSDNRLSFSSDGFSNQPKGETFVAGLLEYTNGVSKTGSDVPSVTLTLNSTSADSDFVQELELGISIATSLNIFDEDGNILDEASADFIYFTNRPELGSFRVFENASTSVEVLAEFNSLDLIGFGKVTDATVGFLSPSTSSVPEPTGFSLMLLGITVGCVRRARRNNI